MIRAENIEDVRFEECVSADDSGETPEGSAMPYVNAFAKANG